MDLRGAPKQIIPHWISALWMTCSLLWATTGASGDLELKGLADISVQHVPVAQGPGERPEHKK